MSSDPTEQRFLWPTQEDISSPETVISCAFDSPIPTRVLSNAQAAYAVWRDAEARLRADERHIAWLEGEEVSALAEKVAEGRVHKDAIEVRSLQEHVRFKLQAEEELGPRVIAAPMLPHVVRAARAYSLSGMLKDGAERVDAHVFDWPGGRVSVLKVVEHYSTHLWIDNAMTDSDYAVIHSQQQLLAADPYEQRFRAQEAQFRQEAILAARRQQASA